MTIRQLSIFLENKSGRLADITRILRENEVDIRALCIADTTDYGILRMIVNQPDRAVAALKAAGSTVSLTEVVGVVISDRPGGLDAVMQVLGQNGIDTEYMYAFLNPTKEAAVVILRVTDTAAVAALLCKNDFQLLSDADISAM